MKLYESTDVITEIEIAWLRWAGHIPWIDGNDTIKAITESKLEGRTRVGRPKKQWIGGMWSS